MSSLSTHVLDIGLGRPAGGLRVSLVRDGTELGAAVTDADGRVRDLVAKDPPLPAGLYRLTFSAGEYFQRSGRESFWDDIVVQVRLGESREHYHVPLLLGPYSYTTYRGS